MRAPDETVSALSTHLFDRTDMCTAVICWQGNRVLSEKHLQQVVLSPSCLQPFALDAHFQAGFPLQCRDRLWDICLSVAMFWGLWSFRTRLWSSRNVTSRLQWVRTASSIRSAGLSRLLI